MTPRLLALDRKVFWFAAFGAAGCAIAALAGELWLLATRVAPKVETKPVAVCLLLDCSGSMAGEKLTEMKRVAADFVQRPGVSQDQFAVVRFESQAQVVCPLTQQQSSLQSAMATLSVGGSTNMSAGLRTAATALAAAPAQKYILIFTDGMPDSQQEALSAAGDCAAQGVNIIAVGTGDADIRYLARLTKDPKLVFPASSGQFDQAFKRAENVIYGRQLVESAPTAAGVGYGVLRIGVWTLLLAAGVGLALIAGQNLYLHRSALTKTEAIQGGLGSATAGLAAGVLGQLVFSGASQASSVLVVLSRIVGWTLVGLLLGLGLARFVPNLKPLRGLAGGTIGGAIGALGFLLFGAVVGDVAGRLIGAAIVGFCIGAMIALLEATFREAWLEVQYAPGELRNISLGRQPVAIGGDSNLCAVYVAGAPPVALRYVLEDGQILCDEVPTARRQEVAPGATHMVGKVAITVRAAGATAPAPSSGPAPGIIAAKVGPRKPETSNGERGHGGGAIDGTLHLMVRGHKLPLKLGSRYTAMEIPGLETNSSDRVVAEVVSNPNDPSVLGLKNLSRDAWETTTADGATNRIEPGRSIRLATALRLRFGLTEAIVQ